jgi:hypothetical protein
MIEDNSKKDKKIIKILVPFILLAVLFTSILLIVKQENNMPENDQEIVSEEKKYDMKDSKVFKFPQMITFNVLKDDKNVGSCQLFYQEKTEREGLSYLRIKNFQGFGFNSDEWLASYIFAHDFSLYAEFLLKENKKIYEIKLTEGKGFDGKKDKIIVYKEKGKPEIQIIPFTEYPIIDLLAIPLITSKKAVTGNLEREKFNLLFGKSTIIVDMSYESQEVVRFQGSGVSAAVFSINYKNAEMFRLKIFKDSDGYCFPVSVVIVNDFVGSGGTFEIRANKFLK